MVPGGPGGALVEVTYTPGADNDGPGSAGPRDVFDPTVRTISNLLVDQTLGNPSAILTGLQRAGLVAPQDQMAATAAISAAYVPLKPLSTRSTTPSGPMPKPRPRPRRARAMLPCSKRQPMPSRPSMPHVQRSTSPMALCWTCFQPAASSSRAPTSTSPMRPPTKVCRHRSTPGSPCSASSSTTASTWSPRAATARSSFR